MSAETTSLQWEEELFTVLTPIPTQVEYLEDVWVVTAADFELNASGSGETLREAEDMFQAHISFLVEDFIIEGGKLSSCAQAAADKLREYVAVREPVPRPPTS